MKLYATVSRRHAAKAYKDYKERFNARNSEYAAQYFAWEDASEAWVNQVTAFIQDNFLSEDDRVDVLPYLRINSTKVEAAHISISLSFTTIVIEKLYDGDHPITVTYMSRRQEEMDAVQFADNAGRLYKIATFDWENYLTVTNPVPRRSDYISVLDPHVDPEFDDDAHGYSRNLLLEDVEYTVGKDIWWRAPGSGMYVQFIDSTDDTFTYRIYTEGFPQKTINKYELGTKLYLPADPEQREWLSTEDLQAKYPNVR